MKPKARYTWLWIAWVAATLGIEAAALHRSRTLGTKDTLTAHVRCVLGIDPIRTDHKFGRGLFTLATAWAAWHVSLAPAKTPRRREHVNLGQGQGDPSQVNGG